MTNQAQPRTLEIRTHILDYLRSEHPMPVSTKAVQTALGNVVGDYPGVVYPQLLALATIGDVERVTRDEARGVYWRYVPEPGE